MKKTKYIKSGNEKYYRVKYLDTLTTAWFEIDGGKQYPGYTAGGLWNGWAMPLFTYETAMKMAKDMVADNCMDFIYSKALDKFIIAFEGDTDPEVYDYTLHTVNGLETKLYGIGAGAWCWDTCDAMGTTVDETEVIGVNPNVITTTELRAAFNTFSTLVAEDESMQDIINETVNDYFPFNMSLDDLAGDVDAWLTAIHLALDGIDKAVIDEMLDR